MDMRISYVLLAVVLGANVSFAASNYDYSPAVPSYPQSQYGYQSQQYYGNQIQQPSFGAGTADYQRQYYNQQVSAPNTAQTLKGHVVTVPAGEKIHVVTMMTMSSENLTLGQNVNVALGADYYYGGSLIAPAGSSIVGQVLEISKAKRGSINGKLMVRFTQIVMPNGTQVPISALIKTEDGSGLLVGGTKLDVAKDYAKDIAAGSAAGATAGLVMSAISDGKIGKGTALGTAVGAGGGLVKSIWDKGDNVEIPVNAGIELVLTQSITVNPAIYSTNY
ncbi:hypothetical protein J6A31_04405 [bacterium]|nr:hypothetical protein [bacterium]